MKTLNNNIEETRVSFEVAKLLKEVGFGVPCGQFYCDNILDDDQVIKDNLCQRRQYGIYAIEIVDYNLSYEYAGKKVNEDCYSAPTQQLAIDWIRVNFGIHITYIPARGVNKWINAIRKESNHWDIEFPLKGEIYQTPEEAKEAAIKYVLENLI